MVRKYNYYAKRGKTIVGASDGEIGNAKWKIILFYCLRGN